MIDKLTPEQEAKIPQYLNYWLGVGLRTKTIDRERAKEAVNFLYEKILKMPKPKQYIFLDSPMACQLFLNGSSQLWSQLGSQLRNQLGSQLESQLGSQLESQLWSQLESQLRNQLGSQLWNQLESQLGSQLWSQLRNQLGSQKMTVSYESQTNWTQSYYWFYLYVLNEIFPTKIRDFSLFTEYVEHSKHYHHIYLSPDVAVFSDFPKSIKLDSQGKLSCEDGKALEYRDGYGIYASSGQIGNSLLDLQLR